MSRTWTHSLKRQTAPYSMGGTPSKEIKHHLNFKPICIII